MVPIDRLRQVRQRPTHVMARTCVGCRRRDVRSALVRFVADSGDTGENIVTVLLDPRLRLPGRGAWLHPTPECFELAVQRKAFGRALRVKALLEVAAVGEYINVHEQSVDNAAGPAPGQAVKRVPETESGYDADEHPMSTR